MIYFDNAATTGKKPKSVIKAVNEGLNFYTANPGRSGHSLSFATAQAVYDSREKIADFFGASGADRVCFTLNCTHSINAVLKGVSRTGDRIIVSSLEHNAVMRPLKKMGIGFDIADVDLLDDQKTLKNFSDKIKPNTKMIFCTGASNVLGKTLPIKQIGQLCKKKGLLFGVDAAQLAGIMPINMVDMNIDFLCIAAHKGLYAPMGLGILICEKDIENTIIEGGTGTNSIELTQPDIYPEKLESGTINVPAILGAKAGCEFINSKGIKRMYDGEIALISGLYEELKKRDGIELYTPEPLKYSYVPVLSFNVKDLNSQQVAEILSKNGIATRGGLHCSPYAHSKIGTLERGTIRVSVSVFNKWEEIKYFIDVLDKKILKKF